jgi:hypothetical protein
MRGKRPYLWHGNISQALQVVQSVEMDLDAAVAHDGHGTSRKFLKAVDEFHTSISNKTGLIPNDGGCHHRGD